MFRTPRPAVAGATVALFLTFGLSACQTNDPAPAASEPVSATPSPSVSPTQADLAAVAKERNISDAEERYREFLAITNKHAKKGTNAYEEFLLGGYLGDQTMMGQQDSYWTDFTEQKLKQTGEVNIVSMEVTKYEGNPLGDTILGHRVRFKACADTSEVDVLGPGGESVRQGGVPDRMIMDVLMQGQDTVWSVRENAGTGEAC